MKLLFIFYAPGPALFGYSLAYLLRHPDDWTGPAVMLPITALITAFSQLLGIKKMERDPTGQLGQISRISRYGSLALGPVLFVMMYFVLLAP